MKFRSALVTGASGFIGRSLVRRLCAQDVRVVCVARPESALPLALDAVRLERLEVQALRQALDGRQFDAVFHLAAYGVAPSATDSGRMFEANIGGTAAMVEAAVQVGAKAVIYAGSCSEYATPSSSVPIGEDHPLNHESLYGASKAAAGLWGQAAAQTFGVGFQWLRLFGVYGPGEAPHRLLPSLVSRLNRNEPVPLTPGEQWRDFLHIDDAVTGLLLAAEAALAGRVGPFNLCSGKGVTVRAVATQVARLLGKSEELLRFGEVSYRPGEPLWLIGDPRRFADTTGFRPSLSLEQGLAKTLPQLA